MNYPPIRPADRYEVWRWRTSDHKWGLVAVKPTIEDARTRALAAIQEYGTEVRITHSHLARTEVQ
jgi:hypothetical protein